MDQRAYTVQSDSTVHKQARRMCYTDHKCSIVELGGSLIIEKAACANRLKKQYSIIIICKSCTNIPHLLIAGMQLN